MQNLVRYIKAGLLVEAVALPVLLLNLWPKTALGWALVLLFGPPLWLLLERLSERAKEISPGDPAVAAVYGCLTLLLLLGGCVLFSMSPGDYLRPHFY
jgi:hypothetical protein